MMEKIALTSDQMNVMLVAVEHGFKQCEKGNNLQAALASVYDLYEVKHRTPFEKFVVGS